jgi:AcrR family transcriptional regulator
VPPTVNGPAGSRPYDSAVRRERAVATRSAVLRSAQEQFTRHGWTAPVADIAHGAGVSVDTVYTAVGRKPELLLAAVDAVLGDGAELPAEQREYVRRVRAAPTAAAGLEVYAGALARLMPRLAPLQLALAQAAQHDAGCARAWQGLKDRRAANMRLLAADLRAAGGLRDDLDDADVADLVWVTGSVEHFALLTERGWSPRRYGRHLADLWGRLLLRHTG